MCEFKPLVSIVIPVYNGSNYLKEAVDSALAQTYKNIEVIVINDGSKDNTEEIALSYGDKIRYFAKENGGVATALNLAIEKANGEYISWLSHDDVYYPQKIEKQVEALRHQENKEQIVYCSVTVIDENKKVIRHNIVSEKAGSSTKCFLTFDTDTGLNGCSLLIPKQLFVKYGCFNPDLISVQDYELWFRFASAGVAFIGVSDELVYSRSHSEQGCRTLPNITTDADKLHSGFIQNLSYDEIFEYADFDYYIKQYNIYKNANYIKTAAQILKFLVLSLKKHNQKKESIELLNSEIFNLDSEDIEINEIANSIANNKEKPRLLFYSVAWIKGGIETVLKTVFEHIRDDYEIVLVSNLNKDDAGFPLPENVKHLQIKNVIDETLTKRLFLLSVVFNIDIFVCNSNIFAEVLESYDLIKSAGIKTIAVNHGNYFLPYSAKFLYNSTLERLKHLKTANVTTWLTNFNAAVYSFTNDNGFVLPNPNSYPITECENEKMGNTIICVGRFFDNIKRIDRALKVFKSVYEKNKDAKLLLVGSYNEDSVVDNKENKTLKKLIEELDIPKDNIEWVGEIEDVTQYYKRADILMVTSESEGFCMVINEAAAFGVPCVYFQIAGLDDIITNNVNGICIEQDDINSMATEINRLLQNKELLKEMSNNAQKLTERFETTKIIDKWKFLIDLCLNNADDKIREILLSENKNQFNYVNVSFVKNLIKEYETCLKKVISNPTIECVNVEVPVYMQPLKRKRIANNRVWRLFYRCFCRPLLKIVYGKEKVHTKYDPRLT